MIDGELWAIDLLTGPEECRLHSVESLMLKIRSRGVLERVRLLAESWHLVECRVRGPQSRRRIERPIAINQHCEF